MTPVRFILSLIAACILSYPSGAQDTLLITINGHAYNKASPSERLEDLMIINLSTSQGIFGKADGNFSISLNRNDTFMVASTGYEFLRYCYRDSTGSMFRLEVPLAKLNVNLKSVTIFSPRDLQSIYKDIEKLGYNKKDYQIEGVDALESPITFLYEEFSRRERLKRHNAELVNEDKKRNLLKELLANYVAGDIIYLDDAEFDDFIDFCDVPEEFMKRSTQYDFCMYIKHKFELYRLTRSSKKNKSGW